MLTGLQPAYAPSTLKDGRAIASFACRTFIRAKEGGEDSGIIIFVPAFSDDELRIDEPDSLQLNVALPADAVSELWIAVQQGHNIILGGEIAGLPSKHPYGPTLSPYEWDTERDDNRTKKLSAFCYSVLSKAGLPSETKGLLVAAGSQGSKMPYGYAEQLRKSLKEKYPSSSQIQRMEG